MPLRRLVLLASLCASATLGAQPAPDARIRAVLERPEFAHASWGMEFYDLDFRTRVYRTGPIRNGVLEGDLVLVAVGDPNLSGRRRPDGTYAFVDRDHSYGGPPLATDPLLVLRDIARQIAARGITAVTGQVIVDASHFEEGDRELGTRVVLSPMVVKDNVIDIVVTPGARTTEDSTNTDHRLAALSRSYSNSLVVAEHVSLPLIAEAGRC